MKPNATTPYMSTFLESANAAGAKIVVATATANNFLRNIFFSSNVSNEMKRRFKLHLTSMLISRALCCRGCTVLSFPNA
jgi:hypothetical protein